VKEWKTQDIKFITQLGDLIDGLNKRQKESEDSLKLILDQFEDYEVHHLVGNHELYNFGIQNLTEKLCPKGYYDFSPHPQWRFIVIDGFELCTIQKETSEDAFKYLSQYNPNDIRINTDWTKGLEGLNKRFMPYNGAVSDKQLKWLNDTLDEAAKMNQKVIILTHVPIAPGSCTDLCLLWNYDQVLDIIYKKDCVKAVLAGHDHKGGFVKDKYGIYHRTFEAVLEAPPGKNAHCTIQVYPNKLVVNGSGIIKNEVWDFY